MEDNKENLDQGTEGAGQDDNAVEFDVSAFSKGVTTVPNKDSDADSDGDFSWASANSKPKEEERVDNDEEVENENEDENTDLENNNSSNDDENNSNENNSNNDLDSSLNNNESFKQLNEELGTEFETVSEMKEHFVKLKSDNERLSKSGGGVSENEAIKNLKQIKENSNEDLVRMDLERQGFKGEDLEDAMDKITDNGMIDVEAKKILNTVDRAIESEKNKLTQSSAEADAKQQQEYDESVKLLTNHINGEETKFGFKMAKDEEGLKKVRAEHQEYITSGSFLGDITKDAKSISDAAWLWKHKEVLMNALSKKGHTKGRMEVLNDIGVLESKSPKRMKGSEPNDGFDPSKFVFGS